MASHLPEKNQPQYGHPGPSQTMGLFPVSTNVSYELRLSSGAWKTFLDLLWDSLGKYDFMIV